MSKQMIAGSVDWLMAHRDGAFSNRPPVPVEPKKQSKKYKPLVLLRWEGTRLVPVPMAEHHGKPCAYCGEPMRIGGFRYPTREHVKPRCRGGDLNGKNRLIVCSPCNGDKGAKTLQQFVEWLTKRGDQRASRVRGVLLHLGEES